MSLPTTRRVARSMVLILMVMVIREWNIRRHEAALGEWPRADPRGAGS